MMEYISNKCAHDNGHLRKDFLQPRYNSRPSAFKLTQPFNPNLNRESLILVTSLKILQSD